MDLQLAGLLFISFERFLDVHSVPRFEVQLVHVLHDSTTFAFRNFFEKRSVALHLLNHVVSHVVVFQHVRAPYSDSYVLPRQSVALKFADQVQLQLRHSLLRGIAHSLQDFLVRSWQCTISLSQFLVGCLVHFLIALLRKIGSALNVSAFATRILALNLCLLSHLIQLQLPVLEFFSFLTTSCY